MFDRDRFVADCQSALKDAHAERAVREVVARAVAEKQVIHGWIILVDGLDHRAHAQYPRKKFVRRLDLGAERADVMDAGKL